MSFLRGRRQLAAALLSVALVAGVGAALGAGTPPRAADPRAAFARPDAIPFPTDNPFREATAQLGHVLFFDPRLSGSGAMSCASCHNPALGWEDGMRTGRGEAANTLGRSTPTILNIAWAEPLMWDGRAETLEHQALGPIQAEVEMNLPIERLVERLSAIPGYRRLFRDAYGDDRVTPEGIARALATFQRTVVSNLAPFDRWVRGEEAAISEEAKRGFALFTGRANCAACHSGWRFTDDGFHDIGLASPDIGRGAHLPELVSMRHAFKTPTLRNIAERAPYMHDGSSMTLREAVIHYDTGFVARESLSPEMRRLNLSPREVDDIVAFLRTLSSVDDPIPVPILPTEEMK